MGTLPFYAEDGDTSSVITTMDTGKSEKKKIPLHVKDTKDKITYSLVPPIVYAYLSNKVVSVDIDLNELLDTFTIRIISLSIGEEVTSQTAGSHVEIDLSDCDSGIYQLDIISEDEWLQGEFTL